MNPPRRILLVEDDDVLRRANTEALIESGYEVDAAKDGAVAWAALQLFDYGLLVTDDDIPNVSGLDLVKKLSDTQMVLPVILMSGTLSFAALDRPPWRPIEATVRKPHTPAELLATVRNVLGTQGDARELIAPLPSWPAGDRLLP